MATIKNLLVENLHRTNILEDVASGATQIKVADTSGFPTPTQTGEYFYATILDTQGNMQILKIKEVSGNTIFLVDGTTVDHPYTTVDGRVETWFVAEVIQDIQDYLDTINEVTADEVTIQKVNYEMSLKSVPTDLIEPGMELSKLEEVPTATLVGNTSGASSVPSAVTMSDDVWLEDAPSNPVTQSAVKAYVDNLRAIMGNVVNNYITDIAVVTGATAYSPIVIDSTSTSITPVANGSWIKIDVGLSIESSRDSVFYLEVSRDGGASWTAITIPKSDSRNVGLFPMPRESEDEDSRMMIATFSYIDESGETAGVTVEYRVVIKSRTGQFYLNRTKVDGATNTAYERATSYVHLSEIPK